MAPRSGTTTAHNEPGVTTQRSHPLLQAEGTPELVLQGRRRTLQTISELSPQYIARPKGGSNSFTNTGIGDHNGTGVKESSVFEKTESRRRSLPPNAGSHRVIRTQPTILITDADTPALGPSLSTPIKASQRRSNVHEARPRSEIKGGQRLTNSTMTGGTHPSAIVDNAMKGFVPYGGSSQGRQYSKGSMRKQAIAEVEARRGSRGRRISMGSSSTLPSLSPPPISMPAQAQVKGGGGNQQQLLQNSKTINWNHSTSRSSHKKSEGHIAKHASQNDPNTQLLKQASTKTTQTFGTVGDTIPRPHSTLSNATTRPLSDRRISSQSLQSPTLHPSPRPPSGTYTPDRIPRSTQLSGHSILRSSSANSSNADKTSVSNTPSHSRKSPPAPQFRSSSRGRRHCSAVTQEHLDTLAALTAPAPMHGRGMHPDSLMLLQSEQKNLDEKTRRASMASGRAHRISQIEENRGSRSTSKVSQRSYGTNTSKGHTISTKGHLGRPEGVSPTGLDGSTPESVRLLREREKLLRWKAEREKVEFERREREKIRERVRRANEMEEARHKELKKNQKKRSRGCCCFLHA